MERLAEALPSGQLLNLRLIVLLDGPATPLISCRVCGVNDAGFDYSTLLPNVRITQARTGFFLRLYLL